VLASKSAAKQTQIAEERNASSLHMSRAILGIARAMEVDSKIQQQKMPSPNSWKDLSGNFSVANDNLSKSRQKLQQLKAQTGYSSDDSEVKETKNDVSFWKAQKEKLRDALIKANPVEPEPERNVPNYKQTDNDSDDTQSLVRRLTYKTPAKRAGPNTRYTRRPGGFRSPVKEVVIPDDDEEDDEDDDDDDDLDDDDNDN